jgi:hypothetical protein
MRTIFNYFALFILLLIAPFLAKTQTATSTRTIWGTYPPQQTSAISIEGKLLVSGFPRDGRIKQNNFADLYKAFNDGIYKIRFQHKVSGGNAKNLMVYNLKTIVKHDGKTIIESTRNNWPMLQGDILIPIEAFEIVTSLPGYKHNMHVPNLNATLPKGKYEVILGVEPAVSGVKSRISQVQFNFIINGLLE